ncbi:ROK family protein [Cesiribacter sp. SM1]|uniref:ROK family protein n=1 Tax=Cesiribacter sp. SM1 TaxID=2861196 RepID=UPI001CD49B6C|nr:ROK family protein [Cesiribacter sp. SM1]
MKDKIVLGIDIGGSHITVGLVNLETRLLLADSLLRRRVDSKASSPEIIASWIAAIQAAIRKDSRFSGKIGIAMPGPFDYKRGISLIKDQDKYDALYGLNVKQLLAEGLRKEVENIRMMNDARSFMQGEVYGGAARGCTRAIGLTLGTGLGSARFRNGEAEDADLWRSPFKAGIAEDYLSARWFIQRFHALTGDWVKGVKDLVHLAQKNSVVRQVFEEFGDNLAEFLQPLLMEEDPEIVVLGGNIARAYDLYVSSLEKKLDAEVVKKCIRLTGLGEKAALVGAASCWDNNYSTSGKLISGFGAGE